MRAFQLHDYIGPDGLRLVQLDPPVPGEGELLLKCEAIGVNFPDLLMTKGQYQYRPELPVVPGCEVAGCVISAPAGSGWKVGDRVAAFVWQGSFAEFVVAPLNSVARIPDSVGFDFAAATVVNYHTVHFGLASRGQLQPGETVLVMGAAGGIGTAAVQVARGLGARVIAGVADQTQVEVAQAAGASEVVVLDEGFSAVLKGMTDGRGVDVVVDPLGAWLFDEAVRGLAPGGRLLVVGFAAGGIPSIKVNRLLLRNISVVGVAFGAFLSVDPTLMKKQSGSLDSMISKGILEPYVGSRFGFDELPRALQMLDRGEIRGKGIVRA